MEFFIEPLYIGFFVSGLSFLAVVHWYFNGNFNYWKKKGVPYLKPEPFFGNLRDLTLLRTSTAEMFQKLYHEFEGHPFAGLYQSRTPALLLRDPELIKIFLAKDFQHSQHRGFKLDEKRDPLTANIFTLGGPRWRILRTKLTPSFTSVKIKQMFHLMEECSETLQSFLLESAKRGEEVELKEVLAKFSTDIIGTCAFGIQSNSMTDPDSEFRKMGRKMFDPTIASALRKYMQLFLPTLAKILNVSIIGKEVTRFFTSVVKETVEYREKHGVMRNDFLQLLMQLRTQIRSDVAAAGNKNEERFVFHRWFHLLVDQKELSIDPGLVQHFFDHSWHSIGSLKLQGVELCFVVIETLYQKIQAIFEI
ncbi:cytochrome P450 6k1-like [Anabrus simplex]|uniref:cytochrome P450 6k1-like n=1 Tax=Anabrus simplex TaxID=316456 RepID=UPI0035A2C5DF